MEAFELALRLGATGLESDVWVTADGVAVLDHDGLVGRRPLRRPISEVMSSDLPRHIPTLREFYDVVGRSADFSLDIKDPAVAAEVVACARDVGAEDRLWLCHPDRHLVSSWRDLSSSVHLVESTRASKFEGSPELHIAQSAELGIEVINLHHSDWTGGSVAMAHRFGLLAFGFVSRRFERQADTYAVRLLSERDQSADATPASVNAMAGALSMVAFVNHVPVERPSWRHGSIAWRQAYLRSLAGRPHARLGIDSLVRAICALALVAVLAMLTAAFVLRDAA